MLKRRQQRLVDDPDSGPGRVFAWFIQATILVSILDFTLATLPEIDSRLREILWIVEVASVAIFTVELLLRLAFSSLGFRYLLTFFGIVDLVAILPFYLGLGIDLRGVRAFRLRRLFRLFKLARYSKAMRRYHIAFRNAREDLLLFGATALVIIFVAAVGIHYFESKAQPQLFGSIPACLWWATTTLTTVGYGDAFLITVGGKLFTFVILAVALPSGILATALHQAREEMKQSEAEQNTTDGAETSQPTLAKVPQPEATESYASF